MSLSYTSARIVDQTHTANSVPPQHVLLSRSEAAAMLGVKVQTLACWACNKRYDLKCIKVGSLSKYRLSDVLAFLERRTVQ